MNRPVLSVDQMGARGNVGVETPLRPTRRARVIKTVVFERVRRVEVKLFATLTTGTDLEDAIAAWLAGNDVDVLDLQTTVAMAWDDNNNEVSRTYFASILYAPDDDRTEFEDSINDWCAAAGEKDFIEISFQHTDRVYRAEILYAE